MEPNKPSTPNWTVKDLQDLYNLTLKFPAENFASPEFWQKTGRENAISPKLKSADPKEAVKLWESVLSKSQGKIKIFQSLLSDYVVTVEKNKLLGEKMKKSLVELFFAEPQAPAPVVEAAIPAEKVSAKRPVSEKSVENHENQPTSASASSIVPTAEDLYEFRVSTEERFPRIDLRLLVKPCASLTQFCDTLDRQALTAAAEKSGSEATLKKFIECYTEATMEKAPEKWRSITIKVEERKKPAEIKLDMMRRELKMLQQC